MIHQQHIKSCI